MPTDESPTILAASSRLRLAVLALLAALCSWLLAVIPLAGRSRLDLIELGWIASQSIGLVLPGWAAAWSLRRYPPLAACLGSAGILLGPALLLLDAIVFHWIGHHLLSAAVWRVVSELRDGLSGHVSPGMARLAAIVLLTIAGGSALMVWMAGQIALVWQRRSPAPSPRRLVVSVVAIAVVLALPAMSRIEQTGQQMAEHPSSHPLCVIGWLPFRQPTTVVDRGGRDRVRIPDSGPSARPDSRLADAISARDHQHRRLAVDPALSPAGQARRLPDLLIVVVESFRRELLTAEGMPNLHQYASRGVHCRSHFSGGNATNHGMFSLLNGLDAIWYERPVRFSPLMNRLLRSAGYEIGFFAGHDDWAKFAMDGYLSPEHFDVFETSTRQGLESDRRATWLASRFLERGDAPDQDRPRAALLYLYATHATYDSYPEDRHFAPAADDRFLYPYQQSARQEVWNRYRNSARTVDRFLAAVLRDDRVIVVTGDHGESFLEDGVIGHGIRISEYQNMTPAVFFAPGCRPGTIDWPTSHADILPTLLATVGLALNEPEALDGVDLFTASQDTLSSRVLVTRNYLERDVALIGPWTVRAGGPFAYRMHCDLSLRRFEPIDAIDHQGRPAGQRVFQDEKLPTPPKKLLTLFGLAGQ